ncbi:hybrid sensor histidine kinase/response regulator [Phormidium sp. CCY1219]|uniref:hybrid sensor histidine kinase/response regulator n=1 Tax=Phormidium sp. CCY1219 TaxID=2886104 RepID=UPI002D1F6E29|nr:response regulator [Phormidium sp. CCY1219]MEB3829591.1 response regulator [Phormidium sp. CCY1219]
MERESVENGVILVVDDSPTNLGILSDLLDENGFEVRVARDGESAIQKVEFDPPDLILLDVMMPGINGFETCKRLKCSQIASEIPVILMSALSDPVDKVKGLNQGAVDYITKPFQQQEVLARVRVHLKLRFLTKELEEQNQRLKREIEERSVAESALQELTVELEKRVEERTAELTQSLEKLQQAQTQLVQSEKMASIGQVAAGIGHEINNPVGFVCGNLGHIEDYTKDIIEHLKYYQQYYPNPVPEIQRHREEIDLDYIIEDLPNMTHSMKLGIDRIRNISLSLRNFSRSDTSTKVPFDLREGLESTLLILTHRLKAHGTRPAIAVEKAYQEMPLVECYPAPLNQVFMNLLANAIDALDDAISRDMLDGEVPTIYIRIEQDKDKAIVRIADNGLGMTEEVYQKAFNPMFTTKPMGKGTGLGLSISRQIIEEKHGGTLTCKTTHSQGTEFAIALPL